MRDLLYVPPGRAEPTRRDRPARARVREPGVRRARPGDGDAGDRRGLRHDPLQHGAAPRCARSTTCTCSSSGASRGWSSSASEITDVRGEHSHYAQLLEQGARLVFVNGGAESLRRDRRSASTSGRRAGSRPSTCSSWATAGSASSPATSSRSPTREKARGREDALRAAGLDADARRRARRLHGGRRPPNAPLARRHRKRRPPDRGDLLERPDGDRRAPGGGHARARASRTSSRSSASTGSRRRRGRSRR